MRRVSTVLPVSVPVPNLKRVKSSPTGCDGDVGDGTDARPIQKNLFQQATEERLQNRISRPPSTIVRTASSVIQKKSATGVRSFTSIEKRKLGIQQTTEDLLSGAYVQNMSHTSNAGSLEKIEDENNIMSGSGSALFSNSNELSMKERGHGMRKRTIRLSQVGLKHLSEKVQRKEQSTQQSAAPKMSKIGTGSIVAIFVTVFLGCATTLIGIGFGINANAGPVWERWEISEAEAAQKMQLDRVSLSGMLDNFLYLNHHNAASRIIVINAVNCVLFSIMVQVTMVMIQVGAKEFSANALSLFMGDKILVGAILFYTMSLGFMLPVNCMVSEAYLPRGEILLGSIMALLCVLGMIPYFLYLSRLLNPLKLVRKVAESGLKACTFHKDASRIKQRSMVDLARDKQKAIWAVENITQFGLNAMKNQRSNIAYTCVEVLSLFLVGYGTYKDFWQDQWFEISQELRDTPDFFSLTDEGHANLQTRRCWLEWKVLRQYRAMFVDALDVMKDVVYVIAVNTRRIAAACAKRHDYHAFEYAVRFFNTFIRLSINKRDTMAVHNVLHQYRILCQTVLSNDAELVNLIHARKEKAIAEDKLEFFQVDDLIQIQGTYFIEEARDIIIAMEKKVISMTQYLLYYSSVAQQVKTYSVSESIAHELGLICQSAFLHKRECHQELLLTFLMLHESYDGQQGSTLWGIRGAQIKLATFYAANSSQEFFKCIQNTFKECSKEELILAWRKLERVNDREFWEINDRGTNLEYLTPKERSILPHFFAGLGVTADDLALLSSYDIAGPMDAIEEDSELNHDSEFGFAAAPIQRFASDTSQRKSIFKTEDFLFASHADRLGALFQEGAQGTASRENVGNGDEEPQPGETMVTLLGPDNKLKRTSVILPPDVADSLAKRHSQDVAKSRRRSSMNAMLRDGMSPMAIKGSDSVQAALKSLNVFREQQKSEGELAHTSHATGSQESKLATRDTPQPESISSNPFLKEDRVSPAEASTTDAALESTSSTSSEFN